MKIRILTSRGGYPCGAEPDVDDELARAWIGVGDAELVQTSAQPAAGDETAAAAADIETAMKKKARGR